MGNLCRKQDDNFGRKMDVLDDKIEISKSLSK